MLDPQERLAYLVEYLNDTVYTVDVATNRFTSLSHSASKLTGFPYEELLGGSITSFVAPESMPVVQKMIKQKLKKDTATIYEIELVHKNGRRIPVEISSRMIYKDGKPSEILGIARDITERKQAERQKEIFSSLITHEIKNPLTAIKMYTEILQKEAKKQKHSKQEQMLSSISLQVETLSQLLNDFMDVNQLQLRKFGISKEPFDLAEVVDDVIRTFKKQPSGPKIEFSGKITKKIHGDRLRIRQVLYNLLSNALKYAPDSKKVVVSLTDEKKTVLISVQDFGAGIPKNEQKAIFDLYYRAKNTQKKEIKGHGLGLYICQEIIKSHKGKIWVESEEGVGSTFYISLPYIP